MVRYGLESLRNRHAGRLAIIAGAGPSLRHLEPVDAYKHIMICVNSSIIKYPDSTYFFSCDPAARLYRIWNVIKESNCTIVIATVNSYEGYGHYDSKIGKSYEDGIEDRLVKVIRKPDGYNVEFHNEDKELVHGHSSVHCAAHFAYILGCSPIVLVGCDCGCEDGKRYFYDYPGQEQYKDYVTEKDMTDYVPKKDLGILNSFTHYWDRIGSDNPTVEILNCGNAIIPNIMPAKLEDVLKKYDNK